MQNPDSSSRSWRISRFGLVALAGLITLVALFYAEENWRGKRAWEAYRRQLEAKGVVLDLLALAPRSVPDEQNFAMTPFLAPLFDFNPKPLKPGQDAWRDTNGHARTMTFGYGMPLDWIEQSLVEGRLIDFAAALNSPKEVANSNAPAASNRTRAELAGQELQKLEQFNPVLDELRTASRRPYSRFNISYGDEDPVSILLPHLAVLRRISQILCLRASAELALGKTDAAFDDLGFIFFLSDSIHDEPIVISQLVRIAMLKTVRQVIWEGLAEHRWSDSQLQELEIRLQKFAILQDMDRCVRAEKAAFGNGEFELLHKHQAAFKYLTGSGSIPARLFELLPKGWIYMEQVSYHRMFDEKILQGFDPQSARVHPKIINNNAKDLNVLLKANVDNLLEHRVLARFLLLPPVTMFQKAAKAQTDISQTLLVCALERYRMANGSLPETLDALVPQFVKAIPHDIITGEPMKYQRITDGQFVLYSVGWNEKDDGGTVVMTADGKGADLSQGDWVWPQYPAK